MTRLAQFRASVKRRLGEKAAVVLEKLFYIYYFRLEPAFDFEDIFSEVKFEDGYGINERAVSDSGGRPPVDGKGRRPD